MLSKWLVSGPDVLILDEPTRGIDVGAKYEIYGLINQLAAQGKAVVMISSELPELLGMCDRIYTISEGAITGDVPRAEATQESLMYLMTMGKEALTMSTQTSADPNTDKPVRFPQAGGRLPAVRHPCRAGCDHRALRGAHRRPAADAGQREQPDPAELLRADPRDRHGHGDHRRPHRPLGRIARSPWSVPLQPSP